METSAQIVAQDLLQIGAVDLRPEQPFTWASGLQAPIYTDNRLTISYPQVRKEIIKGMLALIKEAYPAADLIAGTATAGIPHAAWVADKLNLPMVYVRDKPKVHGQGRQIEGVVKPGQRVVMIEDLLSTGGSVLGAVKAVRAAGGVVIGVVAIFSYQLPALDQNFAAADLTYRTVTNYGTLIEVATAAGDLTTAQVASLHQWRRDPMHWQK